MDDDETNELNKAIERFQFAVSFLSKDVFQEAHDFKGHEHCISEGLVEVRKLLFRNLVTIPCALENIEYESGVQTNIKVVPQNFPVTVKAGESLLSFSLDPDEDLCLLFIEFMELDPTLNPKLQVRFKIISSNQYPELVGFHGMVNANLVQFQFRKED